MKILITSDWYIPAVNGVVTSVKNLRRELEAQGHEVRVLTPTTPDSVATRIQKGFTRNLEGVVNGLVNFTVWLLSSLPTLILLAAVLALIGVIGRLLYRFIKKAIRKALTQKTGEPKPPAAAATPPAQQQPPQEKP